MADIIKLLPDHVANQIAAGEVIQRPASLVKELLENSLDAGATHIKLVVKDGGKTLVQVIDNGKGMSETDARMCFERHATSKISKAEDLFRIKTMGFRGEAMASIAAVAHLEMKTRQHGHELGTLIVMEGSEVKQHEKCHCDEGTSISVKNLFFNIPARRQFLKNDLIEMRHILDEFFHVAMANPAIQFQLFNSQQEVYRLAASTLKKRMVDLLGNNWNERLVQVEENTNIVNIRGFIGKPDSAKKSRGDQYFFINNRFVRNNYLHHAVQSAFQDLIQDGYHPVYAIFFDVNPASIDINIHPTKTEVKFEDEKSIYAVLRSAIKKSLGQFSFTPSIDFENEPAFEVPILKKNQTVPEPTIKVNPYFNPFDNPKPSNGNPRQQNEFWQRTLTQSQEFEAESVHQTTIQTQVNVRESNFQHKPTLFHEQFIITQVKSGVMVIDRLAALERIAFDRFQSFQNQTIPSQKLLFPAEISLHANDLILIQEIEEELRQLGFEFEIDNNQISLSGIPTDLVDVEPTTLLMSMLDDFKNHFQNLQIPKREKVILNMAKNNARNTPVNQSGESLQLIIDRLFESPTPTLSPGGKKVVHLLKTDELKQLFNS